MTNVVQAFDDAMSSGLVPSVLMLVAAVILVTIVHEGGHLLAALATGQREIAVNIGSHGSIIDRRLGDIRLRANAVAAPWRPAGSVTFDAGRITARDMALIAAAGPAASIAVALLTGRLVSSVGPGVVGQFLALATAIGLFIGLGNLVPLTIDEGTRRRPGARLDTDGRQIVDALRVMVQLRGT